MTPYIPISNTKMRIIEMVSSLSISYSNAPPHQ